MKPKEYAALVRKASDIVALLDEDASLPDGWLKTREIIPLIGLKTLSGTRGPIERIVQAGFAQVKRISRKRLAYRLSPKFKTWPEAFAAATELERFKVPAGWVSLFNYARSSGRTVRGIQYRIDAAQIPVRVFPVPRPVKHYRKSDLDRIYR